MHALMRSRSDFHHYSWRGRAKEVRRAVLSGFIGGIGEPDRSGSFPQILCQRFENERRLEQAAADRETLVSQLLELMLDQFRQAAGFPFIDSPLVLHDSLSLCVLSIIIVHWPTTAGDAPGGWVVS